MIRYPMKMIPAFKDYIWGGSLLTARYGKPSPYARTAESWELSCHPDGKSAIGNGAYEAMSLSDYVAQAGKEALGTHCARFGKFPVLIKLIDAARNLSVQVHPGDAYAMEHEHEYGKTEMWYVVDCKPGASLIYGFNRELSKEEFRRRVENNTLLETLNTVPVQKGDTFFVRPGTLHGIGEGCLIAEIQQSSNLTYRVYDYGRVGADGRSRELHLKKAQDVIRFAPVENPAVPPAQQREGCRVRRLAACPYFSVDLLDVEESARLEAGAASFHALICTEGSPDLLYRGDAFPVREGDTYFLPAGCGEYFLKGRGRVLLTRV